jgi:hypothetical protein
MRHVIICTFIGLCLLGLIAFGYLIWTAPVLRVEYANVAAIAEAERQWQDAKITNYQLTLNYVTFGADLWAKITVADGTVVAVECRDKNIETGCKYLDPTAFTVPGLFAIARQYSTQAGQTTISSAKDRPAAFGLRFDSTYHIPRYMVWRLSEYSEWDVTSFTVTE